jgi:hypothetical protein
MFVVLVLMMMIMTSYNDNSGNSGYRDYDLLFSTKRSKGFQAL